MALILGLLMLIAGVALFVLGKVQLWGGRVLQPGAARLVGVPLCAFLPLTLALRPFIDNLEPMHITLINWGVLAACFLVAVVIALRTTKPATRPVRRAQSNRGASGSAAGAGIPVVDVEPYVEPDRPTAPRSERSPFDFS